MKRALAILLLSALTVTASAQDQKPKHHHKKIWIAVVASVAAAGTIAYVETQGSDHRKMFRLHVPFPPVRKASR